MKKVFYLCCIILLLSNINLMSQIIGDNNWETDTLFFIDDFSVDGRTWSNNFIDNRNLWRAYSTEAGVTHGKNEHQVYQKENCIFDDTNNLMKLVSKKVGNSTLQCGDYLIPPGYSCDSTHDELFYYSGEIDVFKERFLYGYFEIKCKLPVHRGAFPAFWLWGGDNTTDPHYEEIDIFEYSWNFINFQYNPNAVTLGSPRRFTTGIYFCDTSIYYYQSYARNYPIIPDNEPDLTHWNIFACEWSPNRVVWYFNGNAINHHYGETVPHREMFLKTNYALDNYILENGHPIPNFITDTMFIDYIKVYKLDCDCETDVLIQNTYDLQNYDYGVKHSISIGSNTENIFMSNNDKMVLRATDFIEITKNFELTTGTEMELIVHPCPENNN